MKHRDDNTNLETAGQDSFLDVTTNIVGILIVLVMVVGIRAQNPIVEPNATPAPTEAELTDLGTQALRVEGDWHQIDKRLAAVNAEIENRSAEREVLATMIAAAEKEIGDRRAKLASTEQEDFDLHRELAESQAAVEHEKAEIDESKSEAPPVEQVNHYPTPLSRTVLGHEVHFQLSGGRIAYVPMDEFIEDVRSDMRSSGVNFSTISDKVGVVGPRNGFEFRYTMDVVTDHGRGIVGLRAKEFQLVPVGVQLGETVEKALSGRSEFRSSLAPHSPRETTVTLWTYPDSFEAYRQIKEELHKMGFATAGRPLPNGVLIGGSDHGTKSSAQ
jgi:hypothetical protein